MESAPSQVSRRISYRSISFDLYDRKPESALAQLGRIPRQAFSNENHYVPAELLDCICLFRMNEERAAREACGSAVELLEGEIEARPHDYRLHSALGQALALLGRDQDAVRSAEHAVELVPISKDAIDWSERAIDLAMIYTRVGQDKKALDLIEGLLSVPCELSVGLLRLDPVWDPLRDHPRFQEILEKYGEEQ